MALIAVSHYMDRCWGYLSDTNLPETTSEITALRLWIEKLPGVTKAAHRFGGIEFHVQGLEFMHFHGQTYMDIRLSKEDQARILNEGKARRHQFAPDAGWVTLRIDTEKDLENAREVVQLAYARSKSIMENHLARRKTQ